jgi:hypothetical protein
MNLTGKCKEEFEKWLGGNVSDSHEDYCTWIKFDLLNNSARYGVYVDFFDSVEIDVLCRNKDGRFISFSAPYYKTNNWHIDEHKTRQEARIEAIKKANEIYNN